MKRDYIDDTRLCEPPYITHRSAADELDVVGMLSGKRVGEIGSDKCAKLADRGSLPNQRFGQGLRLGTGLPPHHEVSRFDELGETEMFLFNDTHVLSHHFDDPYPNGDVPCRGQAGRQRGRTHAA